MDILASNHIKFKAKILNNFRFLTFNFTLILIFLFIYPAQSKVTKCEWESKLSKTCLTIKKSIPNTSQISAKEVKRYIITAKEIEEFGALDINDVLELIPGIDLTQSGPRGQQTSLFLRGTGSNHTLVLLNGIPINDQSTTQGLYDFGVDFVQSIYQIEIYVGPNAAHFGPNAIGGAINFITAGDLKNSFELNGIDYKNNTAKANYTIITDNDWVLNIKGGVNNHETDSAIYGGNEKDKVKNLNGNLNANKWINDNTKFRATAFTRKTVSEYDNSSTAEKGYEGDNLMYVTQFSFDRYKKNIKDYITFHFHKYDREYDELGIIDEYLSNTFVTRTERKIKFSDILSFGIGGEYKYDWGEFDNRGSYTASTKGHIYNTGFFSNLGFKPYKDTTISFYGRLDDHKTTGVNNTYKINLSQVFDKFKIGFTHSTGLRNPSLYELYGTDNYGFSGNLKLNPEKSKSKELFVQYNFFDNYFISLTGFQSNIYDHIEYKNNKYLNDQTQTDLNQSGLEAEVMFKNKIETIKFFGNSLSSKNKTGEDQLRRPDKSYGVKYIRKLNNNLLGPFQLNVTYQHYGKHWDTHSSNWSTILMDSSDLVNLSLTKKIKEQKWSLNITNLLDEIYQRPHGYKQEGRAIRLGFKRIY